MSAESLDPPTIAPAPLRRVRDWLVTVLHGGLVEPIEQGRLGTTGLPQPYRMLVWLIQAGLAASLVVIAAAPWLRSLLELDAGVLRNDSAPAGALWLPPAIATLAVSLVLTAVLHAPWWARLLGQAMAAVYYVDLTLKTTRAAPQAGWVTLAVTGLFVAQLAFLAWRALRRPAWWEPLVVWAVNVTVLVVTTSPRLHPGIPGDGVLLYASWESLVMIGVFIMPVVYASGIGAAQAAVGLVASAAIATAPRVPRALPVSAGVLVLVGTGVAVATLVGSGHGWPEIGSALAAVLVFWLGWWALDVLARRHGAPAPQLTELESVFGTALLVGLLVQLNLVISTLMRLAISGGHLAAVALGRPDLAAWADGLEQPLTAAFGFLDTPPARVPVLLVMLGLAAWWATRGRRGPAQLLLGAAVLMSPVAFQTGYQDALVELIPVLAGLALCVAFVVFAARGRLTAVRTSALTVGGLLVLVFHHTGALSSPLGLVFTGSGALIFGLAWGFLTGSGFANSDGRRWPRESRVMLVLSQFVLTAAMLVLTALFADPTRAFDTTARDALGATVLGTALLACALATCLGRLVGHRSE